MRRTLVIALLALASLPPPAGAQPGGQPGSAVEPRAVVAAPVEGRAGGPVFVDASASVADPDRPLEWRWEPGSPTTALVKLDVDGLRAAVALLPNPAPGTYRLKVVARGIPPGRTEVDADSCEVVVRVAPAPALATAPVDPAGVAAPMARPAAAARSATLYATLYYPTGDLSTRPLREGEMANPASPTRVHLAMAGVVFHALDDQSRRVVGGVPAPRTVLEEQGLRGRYPGTPTLFLQDASGRVLVDPSGREAGRGILTPPPQGPAELLALVQSILGAH